MGSSLTVTAGDTASVITGTLTQNGSAYDLTGASVVLAIKANGLAAVDVVCIIANPKTSGIVTATVPSNLPAGPYSFVFRVITQAQQIVTFPNTGAMSLNVVAALT